MNYLKKISIISAIVFCNTMQISASDKSLQELFEDFGQVQKTFAAKERLTMTALYQDKQELKDAFSKLRSVIENDEDQKLLKQIALSQAATNSQTVISAIDKTRQTIPEKLSASEDRFSVSLGQLDEALQRMSCNLDKYQTSYAATVKTRAEVSHRLKSAEAHVDKAEAILVSLLESSTEDDNK